MRVASIDNPKGKKRKARQIIGFPLFRFYSFLTYFGSPYMNAITAISPQKHYLSSVL
jgi:hypothetical protein